MNFKREIEKKFVVQGGYSFAEVDKFLSLFLPDAHVEEGVSTDYFWASPNVDFIRLRENTKELTVKITDKLTIEDRVEENLKVKFEDAQRWANAVWGNETLRLKKTFKVYYDQFFIVSLYTVEGRSELFLEVESDLMATVNQVSGSLKQIYDLKQEMRSLYQICLPSGKQQGE